MLQFKTNLATLVFLRNKVPQKKSSTLTHSLSLLIIVTIETTEVCNYSTHNVMTCKFESENSFGSFCNLYIKIITMNKCVIYSIYIFEGGSGDE